MPAAPRCGGVRIELRRSFALQVAMYGYGELCYYCVTILTYEELHVCLSISRMPLTNLPSPQTRHCHIFPLRGYRLRNSWHRRRRYCSSCSRQPLSSCHPCTLYDSSQGLLWYFVGAAHRQRQPRKMAGMYVCVRMYAQVRVCTVSAVAGSIRSSR